MQHSRTQLMKRQTYESSPWVETDRMYSKMALWINEQKYLLPSLEKLVVQRIVFGCKQNSAC